MFPYLDIAGFKRRTVMPAGDVDYVENDSPGYIASRIAVRSSYLNGRLRKRYGNAQNTNGGNGLPWGQTPPVLLAVGVAPRVTLHGTPTVGSMQVQIEITTGGNLGAGVFKWTSDAGIGVAPGASGVTLTSSVPLTGTGLTAIFADDVYLTGMLYLAAPPVPEIILDWLATLVTYDAYRKRGANFQDPAMAQLVDDVARVAEEVKEAADSKDGLFDLPVSEDLDSAVTTGGVLGYSEQSPYSWVTIERAQGTAEDAAVVVLRHDDEGLR
jgi:hypothetical protein